MLGCAAKLSPGVVPQYVPKNPPAMRNIINYLHRWQQETKPLMLKGIPKVD